MICLTQVIDPFLIQGGVLLSSPVRVSLSIIIMTLTGETTKGEVLFS